MMFNREIRGTIPRRGRVIKNFETTKAKRESRQISVKKSHDRNAGKLSEVDIGQAVYFQHREGQNWKLGKITQILGQRTYIITDQQGVEYRRNRIHLRPTKIQANIRDRSPLRKLNRTPEITCEPPSECVNKQLTGTSSNGLQSVSNPPKETPITKPGVPDKLPILRKPSTRICKEPAYLKDYVSK
jgi:hypothetical protein